MATVLRRTLSIFSGTAVMALSLFFTSTASAVPQITGVTLGSALGGTGKYAVIFDSGGGCTNGLWIPSGSTTAQTITGGSVPGTLSCSSGTPKMFGTALGYGTMLLLLNGADAATLGTSLSGLTSNKPTNANATMFGAASGPVNKSNISLSPDIPTGTTVTFTIDMQNESPQLVAVMGGTAPTVTYSSAGTGTLTIQTTTFDTTNQAGDTFTSIVGFSLVTDTATLGTTPLQIIAQTNHWVGDIFPDFPGMTSNAKVPPANNTLGSATARCGTTFYGPVGQSRSVSLFIPNSSIATAFGSVDTNGLAITPDKITGFRNNTELTTADGITVTTGVSNFSTTGVKIDFTYTFNSPADTTIGVQGSGGAATPTLTEWGIILTTMLIAGFGFLMIRRQRRNPEGSI